MILPYNTILSLGIAQLFQTLFFTVILANDCINSADHNIYILELWLLHGLYNWNVANPPTFVIGQITQLHLPLFMSAYDPKKGRESLHHVNLELANL